VGLDLAETLVNLSWGRGITDVPLPGAPAVRFWTTRHRMHRPVRLGLGRTLPATKPCAPVTTRFSLAFIGWLGAQAQVRLRRARFLVSERIIVFTNFGIKHFFFSFFFFFFFFFFFGRI